MVSSSQNGAGQGRTSGQVGESARQLACAVSSPSGVTPSSVPRPSGESVSQELAHEPAHKGLLGEQVHIQGRRQQHAHHGADQEDPQVLCFVARGRMARQGACFVYLCFIAATLVAWHSPPR